MKFIILGLIKYKFADKLLRPNTLFILSLYGFSQLSTPSIYDHFVIYGTLLLIVHNSGSKCS